MATGGKLDDDITKSSDDGSTPLCQPCSNDGAHRMAQGYCKTCQEFLCTQCYTVHTIPSICRNHVMLNKSQMPTKSSQASMPARPSPCTISCSDHPEKRIEFYCQVHNTVVCGVCSVLYHKPCDLKYILDMKNILNYSKCTNYKYIVRRLEVLEQDINTSITDLSENGVLTGEQLNAVIERLRAFRKEIEEYFKKREEELIKVAKTMTQKDKKSLEEQLKGLQTMKAKVEESQSKLTSLENDTTDLFVASTQIQQRLTELEREFEDSMTNYKLPEYRFKRDEVVQSLLSFNADLGKIERTYTTTRVQTNPFKPSTQVLTHNFRASTVEKLPSIGVKIQGDGHKPRITGLLIVRPHTLLMVDCNNNKVKAVDTRTSKITSELKFDSHPFDITSINGDQEAAITVPYQQLIRVISTSGHLSTLRSIKVQGKCYGISSTRQNIIISFLTPAMVQVIDLKGNILTTMQTDNNGGQLFQDPFYLTVTMEEERGVLWVTDWTTNILSKFTMDGQLITTYRHGQWKRLRGVIGIGNNQLLVCNWGGHTVDVVGEDGTIVTLVDSKKHGIEYTNSLCYYESEGKLYVGAEAGCEPLSVYKFSHK